MTKTNVKKNEPIEDALRRFKRNVSKNVKENFMKNLVLNVRRSLKQQGNVNSDNISSLG